jgi:hypothetical protein
VRTLGAFSGPRNRAQAPLLTLSKLASNSGTASSSGPTPPPQVFRLIAEGSIDRKMESQIDEKSDAAELVLDGHLLGERSEELNLAELLETAAEEFDETTKTIDEGFLEAEWPGLRDRLREAAKEWALVGQPRVEPKSERKAVPAVPPDWRDELVRRRALAAFRYRELNTKIR